MGLVAVSRGSVRPFFLMKVCFVRGPGHHPDTRWTSKVEYQAADHGPGRAGPAPRAVAGLARLPPGLRTGPAGGHRIAGEALGAGRPSSAAVQLEETPLAGHSAGSLDPPPELAGRPSG